MTSKPLSTRLVEGSDVTFARDLVRSAFAADALCLGPHWIYDSNRIAELYPNGLKDLDDQRSGYHGGKAKGDFTHYGDQSLALLESLARRRAWDAEAWLEDWAAYWASEPNSYQDGATKETLANFKQGKRKASGSHDLAGVSRMGPLLALMASAPIDEQVLAAREQVSVTHGDSHVVDAAEFFTRAVSAVRKGASFLDAFQTALGGESYETALSKDLKAARKALSLDQASAAQLLGQSCGVDKALPMTLWLALSYEGNPVGLLEQNALVGGDSSARGMLLALLLAASGSFKALPEKWTSGQVAAGRIDRALESMFG